MTSKASRNVTSSPELVGGLASRLVRPVPAYWLMMGGSFLWLEIAAVRHDWPLAAMQAVFAGLNLMGIVRWGKV